MAIGGSSAMIKSEVWEPKVAAVGSGRKTKEKEEKERQKTFSNWYTVLIPGTMYGSPQAADAKDDIAVQ